MPDAQAREVGARIAVRAALQALRAAETSHGDRPFRDIADLNGAILVYEQMSFTVADASASLRRAEERVSHLTAECVSAAFSCLFLWLGTAAFFNPAPPPSPLTPGLQDS